MGEPRRYYGLYRGIVIENDDSETKHPYLGRIQVRVDQIYGKDVKDDELPWAWQCSPVGGGKDEGTAYGLHMMPAKDTQVWVMFEQGDPNSPVWIGQCFGEKDGTPELGEECREDMGETYPKIWCLRFPVPDVKGAWIRLHEKKLELVWEDKKYYFEFNTQEEWIKLFASDWEIIVESDTKDVTVKGLNITVEAQEDLTLRGRNVYIEAEEIAALMGTVIARVQSQTEIAGYAPKASGFDQHPV